ncbi:MAG: protein translocase subunit SecD [Vicinamibacterales bacterium]
MYKNLRWKVITVVAVAALAIVAFYPPGKKVQLGLDLKGGVHLVLRVNTEDALKLETQTSAEQLSAGLKEAGVTVGSVRAATMNTFLVEGVPPDRDQQFRQLAQDQVGLSFDRETGVSGSYTFRMKPNIENDRRREAVTQAMQTISRRVNAYGVSEPIVAEYGNEGNRIVVELPGVTDVPRAKELISSTAVLELKLVEAGPAPDEATLLTQYGGKVPEGKMVAQGAATADQAAGTSFYLVSETPVITGNDLRNAKSTLDGLGQPAVGFSLNSAGVTKFSRVTSANVGRYLAIILDKRVQSAPVIEGPITGADAIIQGSFTQQEVGDLSLILRSGALPASLTYMEERSVGPTLGESSIRSGVRASVAGLILVALFMLGYYKLAGFNAIVSITINLLILMGFMAYVGAVMTLPGIAGFILTIGMGVDSNVLIFERIREEIANGKGARQAVAAGFDRVFVTILDTHVASLIAAAFLFQFGTGPIQGFATTLFFGLISNVFTAVFVSRTLFELSLSRRPATARLSI